METNALKIGQVARGAGVGIDTVRYYERRGLVAEPPRRESGYRAYPAEAPRVVRFVKGAQELGFTLSEIRELLRLRDDEDASCRDVRTAAEAKIDGIDEKLRRLRAMRRALAKLVTTCRGRGSTRECPVLEAFDTSRTRRA